MYTPADGRSGVADRNAQPVPPAGQAVWRPTLSAFCASLVGIGLARFAYTPLLPALVDARWFDTAAAAYLGAANLMGYLGGALVAGAAARRFNPRRCLRAAMTTATVSLIACAWPAGFAWFFTWRLLSGISGGVAMVLAAPTILPHVLPARRGLTGGAIFMGVGVGVALSGTLVPSLLHHGLTQAWLGLGMLAAVLTLLSWNGWPSSIALDAASPHARADSWPTWPLRAVYAAYALNAFALVPHMVFLVAFVANGLGRGLEVGTRQWLVYGLGSIAGPLLAGRLADRIGFRHALGFVFFVELLAIGLVAVDAHPVVLTLSSFAVGACTIGVIPLVLGRTGDLLRHHPSAQPTAWRTATVSFAVFQAAGAYLMSFLLKHYGNYLLLFALGAGAVALAFILNYATALHAKRADAA